ncbi:hypothetical protein EVAR_29919_1 [Eumeta japonica]|uniref:Uncharacterized protein n=1 Tax=Eumeta variegata TaxID=151549 RepID=A0A4C1V893_EUMVA|nr:hypothetical protein EVAR_29919_1 [Eumeta japonica]
MPEWKGRVPLTRSHCERITEDRWRWRSRRTRARGGGGGASTLCEDNIFKSLGGRPRGARLATSLNYAAQMKYRAAHVSVEHDFKTLSGCLFTI